MTATHYKKILTDLVRGVEKTNLVLIGFNYQL